jgi:outer membrane protein assembly factor BamB
MRRRLGLAMCALTLLIASGPFGTGTGSAAPDSGSTAPRRLWADRYHDSPNLVDEAMDIEVSPDGSTAFVTGRSDQSGSYQDYVTIAYDVVSGTRKWISAFNGPRNRSDVAYALGVSPDGSAVFVTGYTDHVHPDFGTIAYDAVTGAERWHARYDGPDHGDDVAYALGVSPDGSAVYVGGQVDGPDENYGVVAYDAATGEQLWDARFNGKGDSVDAVYALAVSPDGTSVFVTGFSYGASLTADYTTLALDAATGARKWIALYNGPQNDVDYARSLVVSPDGATVFVTGNTNGIDESADYATIAYDAATGHQRWISRYDGHAASDIPSGLGVSPDGSKVFVTGTSDRSDTPFDSDYATVALDAATGARVWVTRYDHAGEYETARALVVSPDGSAVYVAGEASPDYMTIAYDAATGAGIWVSQTRRGGLDRPNAMAVSPDGSTVLVTGGMWQGDPEYMTDYGTIALST